jgi:hypothetical protein
MALFSKKSSEPAPPPHPVFASREALESASLEQLACALAEVLFAASRPDPFDNAAGRSLYEFEKEVSASSGAPLRLVDDLLGEAVGVLQRSLLVTVTFGSSNWQPHLKLTRRGVKAFASGAPERWLDIPAEP